jgi:predicted esterase
VPNPIPACKTVNASRPFYDDSPPLTWNDSVSGLTRAACVFRPDAGSPLPLVLFFHGSTATADKVYDHTSLRTKASSFPLGAGGTAGFVLASVEGRNIHWPDATVEGGHHEFYYRDLGSPSTNPDFRAADELIDTLVAEGGIDTQRIFVTGWSNGAFFAQEYAIGRYATRTPGGNRVAGAAVYAGGDPFNNIKIGQAPSCQLANYPSTQVPIVLVHRDCDDQVGCSGGQQVEFSIPPGMNVEGWLGTLTATMGDATVTDLMLSDAGVKLHESTGSPIGGSQCAAGNSNACPASVGDANHQHWPDGVEDGSGLDWEPTMLGFLAAHPHP